MVEFAKANNIAVPEGKAKKGKMGVMLGSPTGHNLVLIPDRMENKAVLQVNDPGFLFKMGMLHKSKCGLAFKILSIGLGVVMVLQYISGIFLFWKRKNMRNRLLVTCLVGLIVTVIVRYISL